MKFFNAKFNTTNVDYLLDNTEFTITGDIVDNTATFFASDAKVGDIIYLNGSFRGDLILRYTIVEIKSTSELTLVARIKWDMDGDPIPPQTSAEGIIGSRITNSGLSMITNVNTNGSDELLVSAARSYEQSLLIKENAKNIEEIESKIKFPTLGYSLLQQD